MLGVGVLESQRWGTDMGEGQNNFKVAQEAYFRVNVP
jgi:hypothetical protein